MLHLSSQLNFALNDSYFVNTTQSSEIDLYFRANNIGIENQINEFSSLAFSHRVNLLNQLIYNVEQNNNSIQTISKKLNVIDGLFETVESELQVLEQEGLRTAKDEKDSTQEESGPSSSFKKQPKLHYKDLFRERMFGIKQYRFRLNIQGKVPQTLYKERNLTMKINLVDCYENLILNENAISLHFKIFYSNGEQIETTQKGESFMKGSLNSTLIHGRALFDKVYPREVSRKMGNKKIVLVIYASGMGNIIRECSSRVDPIEIEPLIIYGVKVVTKQNKESKPKRELESEECESQFTP